MKKIVLFVGTRPEAIKMVPVLWALRSRPGEFEVVLCATGQHQQMLEQALADFGERPDHNLRVMAQNQTLSGLSARLFTAVDSFLETIGPDMVLVQGDTTTVQVASLCAFYRGIPMGHVEAGLRSGDMAAPFPEELNRRITTLVATKHFAPTELARQNLLAEGIASQHVLVTGNTVIDALLWMKQRNQENPPPLPDPVQAAIASGREIVAITGHRRESFGEGFRNVCTAIKQLAHSFPNVLFVYPVHLNPHVRGTVKAYLDGIVNMLLLDPLPYRPFVHLLDASSIILTDSGGIQEEGPSLGKPVLVMRQVTERPEGVEAGVNELVGTDVHRIVNTTAKLLSNPVCRAAYAVKTNPYGDGMAGERIAQCLRAYFAVGTLA